MQELMEHAQRLETLASSISDAASQQDLGVSQAGTAIQDLDRGARQNASLVDQTAAAAASLGEQAAVLARALAVFRLPADAASG
jgi:methyl-accepting chemotaxis protein